ncbi:Bug family tripartite tricarboxylate transporter substrate binding protein [Cupriavidus basilensis]|uniref:Bug family tripartite tricarboxylate transporter substrate binding protein n=1 Tax=Cupriavidus TaxID=106589 RepID=UPI000449A18F|nr:MULTISPECIES: tripartite tricarboxylate transporter substrate binding protein [Cupriavidus]KDP85859.1 ABC transporter substrate-binding protein [Cupriavidus sp. SK-3]MDF3882749.1 tripartite tricarboxylate transporter substrate binding protein [Cupriavidus basilensis]
MKRWMTGAFAGVMGLAAAMATGAHAQDTRPVRMMVGAAPGGGTDVMARIVSDKLAAILKQPVVVDNRPGASNTIAADITAKAAPDGNTLLMGVVTSQAIAPHLLKLQFNPLKDLAPVGLVSSVPNVLVVNNQVPAQDVKALVAQIQANPDKFRYSSSGVGSTQHLAGAAFARQIHGKLLHVPYKSSSSALVDLMGGQVDMSFETMPSVINHIKAGKLRALAVTADQRSALLPNVPTLAEAGVPGIQMNAWYGVYAPAGTPPATLQKLSAALATILKDPDTVRRLNDVGALPGTLTATQFDAFSRAEYARYGKLIAELGVKLD